jgi:hypothetical protein
VTAPYIAPPRSGSLEARTSLALKVLAGLSFIGLMLAALPGGAPAASLYTAITIAATSGLTALYVVEAVSIDRQRPWAVAAARPMLVLVAVIGLAWLAGAVARSSFRLPYETVIAAWAWLAPGEHRVVPRPQPRTLGFLAAAIAMVAVVLTGPGLFGWGGVLDVREPDLHGSLAATCSSDGAAGLPATITVTYDWSWSGSSPFPSGLDMLVVGWTGNDAGGRPLYLLGDTPSPGGGIYPSRAGPPSFDMAHAIAAESAGSWRWGIELSEQQLRPGRVELQLQRARDAPSGPEPLTIKASYVHEGLWRSDSTVTCTW